MLMIPNRGIDVLFSQTLVSNSIDLALLDSLLQHPDALADDLPRLLRMLGHKPIVGLDAEGFPAVDLSVLPKVGGFATEFAFGATRALSFDEELRFARRIEFTRARLSFTLAHAAIAEEQRAHYRTLIGLSNERSYGEWPSDLALPDVTHVTARWHEWLHFRNELIEHNLALVERIAMRYRTYGIPHGDLVQHGNLGLIRAADKFDWRHNVRFRTYAEWWIRQSIERATDTDRDVIHVPRPMRQKLSKANRLNRKAGGAKLDAGRFAELMGIDREAAAHAFSIKSGVMSLDRVADEDGRPMRNDLVGPDLAHRAEVEANEHLRARLHDLMVELPSREQEVLSMRFGLDGHDPRTLEEVGEVLGISRERVRQLQARALDQLRDSVPDPRDPFGR